MKVRLKNIVRFKCPRCKSQAYILGLELGINGIVFIGVCPQCKAKIEISADWNTLLAKATENKDNGGNGGGNEFR